MSFQRRPGSASRLARAGADSGSGFCASARSSRAGRVSAVAARSAAGMVTVWLSLIGLPSCPAAGLAWWLIAGDASAADSPEAAAQRWPGQPASRHVPHGREAGSGEGWAAGDTLFVPPETPRERPAANSPGGPASVGPASTGPVLRACGCAGSSRRSRSGRRAQRARDRDEQDEAPRRGHAEERSGDQDAAPGAEVADTVGPAGAQRRIRVG